MKMKPKTQHQPDEPRGRNWQICRIKDVARINPATRIPKNQLVDFFPMDAIGINGGLSHGLQKHSNEANGYSQFKNDDVLFAKVTPCFENEKSAIGRGLAVGVAMATTEVTVLRPRMNITPEFLHYRIKGLDFAVGGKNEMKGSAGLKRVPEKFASDFRFELPEIDEQRCIATWLDLQTTRIDKRRDLLAKKRELLRDLRSTLIGETLAAGLRGHQATSTGLADLPALPVGWQASHTKRLLRFITSGSRGWAEYYADDGDIFLRIGNLTRETIDLDLSDMKYVALPSQAAEGKRTRLRPCDLLVSITADLGSIAVVPELDKPAYVSQHIALCRPKAGVHSRWLGYAMMSPQGKRQLMTSGYGGTKIQLSLDDVRNVWLAVPPLEEQVEIANFLDQRLSKIARQITLIDQLDDLLQQQRKAIIHEAVTGKIDLSGAALA